MNISLSPFAPPENLVSRDGFGSPVSRQPAHLYTQVESGIIGELESIVKYIIIPSIIFAMVSTLI